MPIGLCVNPDLVELRLLEILITLEEARATVHLNWRPEPFEGI